MMSVDWKLGFWAVVFGLLVGWRGAWLWQANAYGKQLAAQVADYDRQLAAKDRAHGREREAAAAAALDQLAVQQDARRDLEDRPVSYTHLRAHET